MLFTEAGPTFSHMRILLIRKTTGGKEVGAIRARTRASDSSISTKSRIKTM
jgi:hypothetical protein